MNISESTGSRRDRRSDITALVITFNEAPNIGRCLERLQFLKSVIVLDSGSTDETAEIVAGFPNAILVHRPFDTFAGQCNFGLGLVETEWVLSLDADYVLTESLATELANIILPPEVAGYEASFRYVINERPLSGTLYPPRIILYRRAFAHYRDEGHGHRLQLNGRIDSLKGDVLHDDRKPFARWMASQVGYARREAVYLLETPDRELSRNDRLRRTGWVMPLLALPYVLIVKRCLFDGLEGWFYALQRLCAEVLIALELIDRRLANRRPKTEPR